MASHYETLGVDKSATSDEIKSAYRKLAMQWHPDRHKGDKMAEEKFKEINEAYETLFDEQKRQMYDLGGDPGQQFQNHGFGGFGMNPEDIIQEMLRRHGFTTYRNQPQQNRDITMQMTINLEDAYQGKKVPIEFVTPSGRKITIEIDIPAGVEEGVKIRYQGNGDQSNQSLPPGDLYVIIIIADHPVFTRHGSMLETLIKVDAITAIIGGKIKVKCINESFIDVYIPAGTQPFSKIRVARQGMPLHPGLKDYGDMLVVIEVRIPNNLTSSQIKMLKTIQTERDLDKT
jgi:DnaJ-class molecular chaperone